MPAPSLLGFIQDLGARALNQAPPEDPEPLPRTALRGRLLRVPATDIGAIAGWFQAVQSAKRGASTWNEKEQRAEVLRSAGQIEVLREASAATEFQVPRTTPVKVMEVIGIPLPKPGFYVAEIASPRLGAALLDAPAGQLGCALARPDRLGYGASRRVVG